ncbi:MAG: GAF domain-containing protein [Anaerolineales bacterium]|nr:GAF domain-containing protein [Anaerolineales bacterium]
MTDPSSRRAPPRVLVIADVDDTAITLISRVLTPAGIQAWPEGAEAPPHDLLVVDITQLRGNPLAKLQARREQGDESPAVVLAAHFPPNRLRDLFRLGVADILNKPFKPEELTKTIFDLAEVRVAETNTQGLASRVEAMREQLRRRTEEVRTLSEIGRTVAVLEDLDSILTRVVEAAAFVTDAEEANIYLAEPGTSDLVLRASKQPNERQATLQRMRVTDTLVGEVYQSGQALLRQPSLDAGPVKVQTGFLVQSLVEVPLRVGPRVVGVLGVYNRLSARRFSEHHQTVLQALADWTGVALEHASLTLKAKTPAPAPPPSPAIAEPAAVGIAPAALIEGLKRTQLQLDGLMAADQFSQDQKVLLEQVRLELQRLSSMRMAVMNGEEAADTLDLPGLVRQIAAEAEAVATRQGLALQVLPDPAMPLLRTDESRIRKVLEALVASSMRRSTTGSIVLETHHFNLQKGRSDGLALPFGIRLPDGLWAAVSVGDTGAPLTAEIVETLTSPQNDPAAGMLGRGLSMGEIRMIVESLGGRLWFEQSSGGVRITFCIPVV